MKRVPLGVWTVTNLLHARQERRHLASPVQLILLLAPNWFSRPGVAAWPLPEHSFRARGKQLTGSPHTTSPCTTALWFHFLSADAFRVAGSEKSTEISCKSLDCATEMETDILIDVFISSPLFTEWFQF